MKRNYFHQIQRIVFFHKFVILPQSLSCIKCVQVRSYSDKIFVPFSSKQITETISEMPKPDLYVLQHKSYSNANKSTFPMFLFQRTMECMLYTSLNHDSADTGTLHAISIPQLQIGRHFNLQVRGVRMSGQELVSNLIREGVDRGSEGHDPSVRIADEDADIFHNATKHEREHLSNCLLQAIAFFDLMVGKT